MTSNPDMKITATKRKLLAKAFAEGDPRDTIRWATIEKLASRHHMTPALVRQVAISDGYVAENPPKPAPAPVVAAPAPEPKPALPAEVIHGIKTGLIYKVLGDAAKDNEDPFVVTRLSQWTKEREALRILLG